MLAIVFLHTSAFAMASGQATRVSSIEGSSQAITFGSSLLQFNYKRGIAEGAALNDKRDKEEYTVDLETGDSIHQPNSAEDDLSDLDPIMYNDPANSDREGMYCWFNFDSCKTWRPAEHWEFDKLLVNEFHKGQ